MAYSMGASSEMSLGTWCDPIEDFTPDGMATRNVRNEKMRSELRLAAHEHVVAQTRKLTGDGDARVSDRLVAEDRLAREARNHLGDDPMPGRIMMYTAG